VSNVTFRYNMVRHVASAFNILGADYQRTSRQTRGILIRHNLVYDVDASRWGGEGRFLLIGNEPVDVWVDHNTVLQSGSVLQLYGKRNGRPMPLSNFRFTNNLTLHNEYGIIGEDFGIGRSSIAAYTTREEIRRNVLAGGDASLYPSDNLFPAVAELMAEFVDAAQDDYRLRQSSGLRSEATDGSMIGANVDAIKRGVPSSGSPGGGRAIPRPPR
jgi:hypothetical protein